MTLSLKENSTEGNAPAQWKADMEMDTRPGGEMTQRLEKQCRELPRAAGEWRKNIVERHDARDCTADSGAPEGKP